MEAKALKPFWTITEVCERLVLGKTSVYTLIDRSMLDVRYFPSARGEGKRKGVPRITGESLARYESGDVPSISLPQRAPLAPPAARRRKPQTLMAIRSFR